MWGILRPFCLFVGPGFEVVAPQVSAFHETRTDDQIDDVLAISAETSWVLGCSRFITKLTRRDGGPMSAHELLQWGFTIG
jgi:hypothetical protein